MFTTIYALATAPGRSGVAVVRISGPEAGSALAALTGRALPAPRRAVLTKLRDPCSGDALDDALVLRFTAPASFTGEDVVELHLHGGRDVVTGVIEALATLPGLRLAEPGRGNQDHRTQEEQRHGGESDEHGLSSRLGICSTAAKIVDSSHSSRPLQPSQVTSFNSH